MVYNLVFNHFVLTNIAFPHLATTICFLMHYIKNFSFTVVNKNKNCGLCIIYVWLLNNSQNLGRRT